MFLNRVELKVGIPLEVEKECCGVKKSLDALMIQKALDESRIRVIAVKDRKLVQKLQGDLGLGRVKRKRSSWPLRRRFFMIFAQICRTKDGARTRQISS